MFSQHTFFRHDNNNYHWVNDFSAPINCLWNWYFVFSGVLLQSTTYLHLKMRNLRKNMQSRLIFFSLTKKMRMRNVACRDSGIALGLYYPRDRSMTRWKSRTIVTCILEFLDRPWAEQEKTLRGNKKSLELVS